MVLQMCWGQGDGITDVLGSRRWYYRHVGVKEMILQRCWGQGDGHIHIQARQSQWDNDDYNTGNQASCHCTVKSQDKHKNPTSAQCGSNKAWFNPKKHSHTKLASTWHSKTKVSAYKKIAWWPDSMSRDWRWAVVWSQCGVQHTAHQHVQVGPLSAGPACHNSLCPLPSNLSP